LALTGICTRALSPPSSPVPETCTSDGHLDDRENALTVRISAVADGDLLLTSRKDNLLFHSELVRIDYRSQRNGTAVVVNPPDVQVESRLDNGLLAGLDGKDSHGPDLRRSSIDFTSDTRDIKVGRRDACVGVGGKRAARRLPRGRREVHILAVCRGGHGQVSPVV